MKKGLGVGAIHTTNQIPRNLGDGGDETEIMFGDWSELMIGEDEQIKVAQSKEAAYKDGGGTMQSAFTQRKTLLLAVGANDFAPDHAEAFAGL